MTHEAALLGAAEVALRASVRFLPSVCTNVFPKVLLLRGSERAVGTRVGLFSGVDAGVLLKVRGNGCFVRTVGAL